MYKKYDILFQISSKFIRNGLHNEIGDKSVLMINHRNPSDKSV